MKDIAPIRPQDETSVVSDADARVLLGLERVIAERGEGGAVGREAEEAHDGVGERREELAAGGPGDLAADVGEDGDDARLAVCEEGEEGGGPGGGGGGGGGGVGLV